MSRPRSCDCGSCVTCRRRDYHTEYMRGYLRDPVRRMRHRARVAVRDAIIGGKMVRGSCDVCGEDDAQAHHDDYTKPLDVRWLCHTHHVEHHRRAVA